MSEVNETQPVVNSPTGSVIEGELAESGNRLVCSDAAMDAAFMPRNESQATAEAVAQAVAASSTVSTVEKTTTATCELNGKEGGRDGQRTIIEKDVAVDSATEGEGKMISEHENEEGELSKTADDKLNDEEGKQTGEEVIVDSPMGGMGETFSIGGVEDCDEDREETNDEEGVKSSCDEAVTADAANRSEVLGLSKMLGGDNNIVNKIAHALIHNEGTAATLYMEPGDEAVKIETGATENQTVDSVSIQKSNLYKFSPRSFYFY